MTEREPTQPERRYERRIALARLAIFWERLWPRLGPALGVVLFFAALSLLDLWEFVPWYVHLAVLVAAVGVAGWLLWRELRGLAWPAHAEGRRRLEVQSGLSHRPLQLLEDELAGNADATTRALWQAHRRRILDRLGAVRVGVPEAGISRRDPFALRAAVGLVLALGIGVAGTDSLRRLGDGVNPDFGGERRAAVTLDAWIGPPAYTGLPPMFLARDGKPVDGDGKVLRVPAGSTLLARVHGTRRAPSLLVDGKETRFAAIDQQNFQANQPLEAGRTVSVTAGSRQLGTWQVEIVADQPPAIAFNGDPKASQTAQLELSYKASDDYGLKRVQLELVREGSAEPFRTELPLDNVMPKEATVSAAQDLTTHAWAGLPVKARLVAEDAIGQTAGSATIDVTLPERRFLHAVSRALIEQRRNLALVPEKRPIVIAVLGALALAPEAYNNDTTAHLSIRTARSRLQAENNEASNKAVFDLLWDVALRIENGNLTDAERALKTAQQKLEEALARGATDEEIEKLIRELQQAMDRYLQALAQEAIEKGEAQEAEEMDPDAEYMTSEDFKRMLDRAREMARRGQRDAAKDMLSQLKQMLDSMKNGRVAKGGPNERAERRRQNGQAMQDLQDMMRKQQELMDRSFRENQQRQGQRGQQGQQGQEGQQGQGRTAQEQEALRQRLREFMQRYGQNQQGQQGQQGQGNPLGRAEEQMGRAGEALRGGEPGQAVGPQGQALQALRDGAQAMMQEMQQQMGEGQDGQGNPNGDPRGDRRDQADNNRRGDQDPLGRDYMGKLEDGLSTKVPGETEQLRSREILEELYRRSGERRRPQVERDYIERLLRRF